MMEPTPVASFEMSQSQLLFQFFIVPFDDPAMLGHLEQSFELGGWTVVSIPSTWWVRLPLSATRSATIVPGMVRLSNQPDEPDVLERRQAGSQLSLRA
jgi:hypothetical protein